MVMQDDNAFLLEFAELSAGHLYKDRKSHMHKWQRGVGMQKDITGVSNIVTYG